MIDKSKFFKDLGFKKQNNMPKNYTLPTLYDEVLQISITKLKEWNYLNSNQILSGTITWSRNEYKRGSISITVNTKAEQPYIELDYKYKDEPRNYKVDLVRVLSNLGKGFIWYFLCPKTNKRCRKLYSVNGMFLHREAFKGCMYETQTYSKRGRQLDKDLRPYFKVDKLYEQLYKKHFKKTYAGKPTKKYLRIMEQIKQAERITHQEIELLMMRK